MSSDIKPNDLRLYAINNRTEITCRMSSNGQVCMVNERGLIQIPGISGLPPYNCEDVLARADQFELKDSKDKPRTLTRAEMVRLLKPPAREKPATQKS
ncbi:MAG: hypothetical protein ACE5IP_08615 [Terriglobia bacterium]